METDRPDTRGETRLRRVPPDDEKFLEALGEVGMPRGDLSASHGVYFAHVDDSGAARGYCGYELLGEEIAFIRSCVVPRPHRGKGVGGAMVGALVDMLAAKGVRELYLFTLDADPFFSRLGFAVIARGEAPDAIRATSQFTMECCADAVLMRRVV